MNRYAKKIISLFVGHRFSKKTTARFYDWLTDGNHAEEKEEALRELFDKTLLQAEEPDLDRLPHPRRHPRLPGRAGR